MRNFLHIIILIFAFISCETFEEKDLSQNQKIYTDRFIELQNEDNFKILNIDSCQNFSELTSKLGEFTCEDLISGLTFSYQDKEYFLTGFSECPTFNGVSCYFRRNIILIKNDSIITDLSRKETVPIENLEVELNKIISQKQNFKYNEQILKPALIHLYIDEKQNIDKTKKVLAEIIDKFQKINSGQTTSFFEYNILFEDFDRTNYPAPPPPPPLPDLKYDKDS